MKILQITLVLGISFLAPLVWCSEVLNFKDWQASQFKQAQMSVRKAKIGPKSKAQGDELYRALLNVEISKDLTIQDYFLVYLSRHPGGKAAFAEATKKMTIEETAILLWAYKTSLEGGQKNEDKPLSAVTLPKPENKQGAGISDHQTVTR